MALALWAGFFLLVLLGIALDLGVFHRTAREVGTREAFGWTAFWIAQALGFCFVVHYVYDSQWQGLGIQTEQSITGMQAVWLYLAGYITEKSLSLDNVVVMALIFDHFRVPLAHQHRVLLWGVLGALVMRLVMIVAGAALIREFAWITYAFGGFLVVSAIRMARVDDDRLEPEQNAFVRLAGRVLPVHDDFEGGRFSVRKNGRLHVTRLAIVLLLVESSDLVFAIDSIPAIFAITTDPFLVVTSNVFAILGLRSLYFAIAPLMARFRYLKTSLVVLLGFVGVKLLVAHHVEISALATLAAIVGIVSVGVVASLLAPWAEARRTLQPAGPDRTLAGPRLSPRGARRLATLVTSGSAGMVALTAVFVPACNLPSVLLGLGLVALTALGSRWWLRRHGARAPRSPDGPAARRGCSQLALRRSGAMKR